MTRAVAGERIRLTAGTIEGEHQLPAKPLAQRLLGDEPLEIGDHLAVAPECEIEVEQLLHAAEAELLEPRRLVVHDRFVEQIGEGRAAPERECPAEQRARHAPVAVGKSASRVHRELLEARGVEFTGLHQKRVARRTAHQTTVGQRAPEL